MTDVNCRTRVVKLDAKRVERLSGSERVHDRLGKCTATQCAEARPLSDNVTDFARVIAVGRARKEGGEGSDIWTEIGEVSEDGDFGGDMVGPTDEKER